MQSLENVIVLCPNNGRFDGGKERGMERQAFLAEIEQVENLPEGERTAAYIDIIDRMNKQLFDIG